MDAAFDLGGGFNPAKGLSVVVPVGEVAGDGPFQTADAVKAAAADGLTSNQGKPGARRSRAAHVLPRSASRLAPACPMPAAVAATATTMLVPPDRPRSLQTPPASYSLDGEVLYLIQLRNTSFETTAR